MNQTLNLDFWEYSNILTKEERDNFSKTFNNQDLINKLNAIEKERDDSSKFFNKIRIVFLIILIIIWITFPEFYSSGFAYVVIFIVYFSIKELVIKEVNQPIKNLIIPWLLSNLFENKINYSPWSQMMNESCNEIKEKTDLLNSYDTVERYEDSLEYTYPINEKDSIVLRGIEIKTTSTHTDSKWRKTTYTTNQCYVSKIEFLNARFSVTSPISIRRNSLISGVSNSSLLFFAVFQIFLIIFLFWVKDELNVFLVTMSVYIMWTFYWISSFLKERNKLTRVENIEFEKKYDVFCKDSVLLRKVLTPKIMEKIVNFENKTWKNYTFYFIWNILYIKFDIGWNYLEFPSFKKIDINISPYVWFYLEIKEIINFVNDVNLIYFEKDYFQKSIT